MTPKTSPRSRARLAKLTASHGGRILLAAIPVGIVATLTMGTVASGSVPVSFSISGTQFQISADQMTGTGFSQYAGTAKDTAGVEHQVAIANIKTVTLKNMCQSVVTDTPMGKVGVKITAGGGDTPATATDMQIGMTDLQGDAKFTNIRIGVDASTVNTDVKGSAGDFAQDADQLQIDRLRQTAWTTSAGVFNLNGMHLQLTDGESCY